MTIAKRLVLLLTVPLLALVALGFFVRLQFSEIEQRSRFMAETQVPSLAVLGDLSRVTTLTAQKAHEKGLELLAHVAPRIPKYLLGDPLRLGQILTNFVNNAVKFTERGEIRVSIDVVERTGDKIQLKFSVMDTDIGMRRTKQPCGHYFREKLGEHLSSSSRITHAEAQAQLEHAVSNPVMT